MRGEQGSAQVSPVSHRVDRAMLVAGTRKPGSVQVLRELPLG